ncbi:unnamed protein product [Calicophoron daubneyi]|uniref:Tetraspanin n=1 Tax=Calicophoron daubneyi TaxID=300641 RepID=A0AAV2TNE8_CALDB
MCRCIGRLALFIVNGVTLALGITLVVVGCLLIWGRPTVELLLHDRLEEFRKQAGDKWDKNKKEILENILKTSSPLGKMILSFGVFVVIISFLGFCGAFTGMSIPLYLYIGALGIITVSLIICVIVYFTKLNRSMEEKAVDLYKDAVENYVSFKSGDAKSVALAFIMPALNCCGVNGLENEFKKMEEKEEFGGREYVLSKKYPLFCCKFNKFKLTGGNCPQEFTSSNSHIQQGCADKLKLAVRTHTNNAIFLVLAIIIMLLVLLVLASWSLKSRIC